MKKQTIMLFGDLHFPYNHIDAFDFLKAVKKKYKPTDVICTGDLIDFNSINYHEKDPNSISQEEELEEATLLIEELGKLFPNLDIVEGNHDRLPIRKAKSIGLHSRFIKDNKEVFNMPKNWNWYHEVNRTLITGQNLLVRHYLTKEPFKTAEYYNTCYVQGHSHEDFKLWWFMDKNKNYWGATIGCLVDDKSLAMAYNKGNLKRPELGCMVIVEGVPKLIPLRLKNNIWTGELE